LSQSTGERPSKNDIITLNMVKELSMIQRTQKKGGKYSKRKDQTLKPGLFLLD
jgi:phage anti-repressor protein